MVLQWIKMSVSESIEYFQKENIDNTFPNNQSPLSNQLYWGEIYMYTHLRGNSTEIIIFLHVRQKCSKKGNLARTEPSQEQFTISVD